MKHRPQIDKSGEDPTECEMCGFRNGGHMADCPAAPVTDREITENGPSSVQNVRMSSADHRQNALTLAYLKATDRRFTGEPLTGFGAL